MMCKYAQNYEISTKKRNFADVEIRHTPIDGILILRPKRYGDTRGYFSEVWQRQRFDDAVGRHVEWVQDNESVSQTGVLRGLHFQRGTSSQGKLVRVVSGRVLDVVVDLRKDSPTFGRHVSVILDDEEGLQLWVPRGFAHGFAVIEGPARFMYKVDNGYDPAAEVTLRFDDPALGIQWPQTPNKLLSPKDLKGLMLTELVEQNLLPDA